jgi:Proprotein convertase P-domain
MPRNRHGSQLSGARTGCDHSELESTRRFGNVLDFADGNQVRILRRFASPRLLLDSDKCFHRSMILSRRPNDDDRRDGFTKWPFMTTHTWGEYPQGQWLLEVSFNSQEPQTGWLKEWSLVLHGTKDPPYKMLEPKSPHSKLAIVKKAHEDRLKM